MSLTNAEFQFLIDWLLMDGEWCENDQDSDADGLIDALLLDGEWLDENNCTEGEMTQASLTGVSIFDKVDFFQELTPNEVGLYEELIYGEIIPLIIFFCFLKEINIPALFSKPKGLTWHCCA